MDLVETKKCDVVCNKKDVENGNGIKNIKDDEVINEITTESTFSNIDVVNGNNFDDEYDFSWVSHQDYNEISQEQLEIEKVNEPISINGYRIVDIDYFLKNSIKLQYNHSKKCTGGRLEFCKENKKGLTSSFIFSCNICDKQEILYTENSKKEAVNKAAVWGILSTGSTYSHMSEFLSVLDIPSMNGNMFFGIQRTLGYVWKESLWEEMQLAGKKEYAVAKANGNIDEDGIPYITVLLDGGWSKRSYGHSYNASSGVAVIIGRATGKLLYLGIRNKFCIVCTRAENKRETIPDHVCFKNWTGTSSAMEPDIIVEGFNSSVSMHSLRYKCFIAVGDSTVYAHIRKRVSYGQEVTKIECTNHCIKNYSKNLYKISKDTTNVSLPARKILKSNVIKELTKMVQKAIYANALGDCQILKEDIRNTVPHVFGCHANCKEYMCENSIEDPEKYNEFLKSGAHHHIYGALNSLISKTNMLVDNETNNRAELFMSILARFNMGKRLNLIQRDSFNTRAMLTGLSYNQGPLWHQTSGRKHFNRSPGSNFKLHMNRKNEARRKRIQVPRYKPNVSRKLKFTLKNVDYGPDLAEIELSATDLETEIENLIERLKVTQEQYIKISMETIGQFNNPRYRTERMNRLTASNFGKVVKRRLTTSCDALVRQILDVKEFCSAPVEYGKKNEIVAIRKFEEKTGKKVVSSGLFVHQVFGYLGATPDGIISETEIIEVKCLFKVASSKITLEEAVRQKQVTCMELDQEGNLKLKESHDYYYQIQGQLAISQRLICYFVVYTGDSNDIYIETINFQSDFWEKVMMPKLTTFYIECLAPEIILNRRRKNLKCKDPPSIIQAQSKKIKIK